jgi:hypothetical protein
MQENGAKPVCMYITTTSQSLYLFAVHLKTYTVYTNNGASTDIQSFINQVLINFVEYTNSDGIHKTTMLAQNLFVLSQFVYSSRIT